MKIITTTGGYTGYKEFDNSPDGYEKAKRYLAKQIVRNGSENWLIVRADRNSSTPLLNPVLPEDRKFMERMVIIEKRRQTEAAIRNLA